MSLFIAAQAFGGTDLLFPAKIGILLASTTAGIVGAMTVVNAEHIRVTGNSEEVISQQG